MPKHKSAAVVGLIAMTTLLGVPPMLANDAGRTAGAKRQWELDFHVRLAQAGQKQAVDVNLTGEWVSTIVAVRPGEYDAALELLNPHLTGNSMRTPSPDALQQAQRRLGRRFWATYRSDGALLAIHFFKDVDPGDLNLLQMIATETQFVHPEGGKSVWTGLERDGAGTYLAVYNWTEPHAVVKRKVKYVRTDGEPGAPVGTLHLNVEQSELRFTLDSEGDITSLEGSERVRMGLSLGDAGQLVAVTETRLNNLQRGKAPELIGSLARAAADVSNSLIVTHRTDPHKLRAQLDARLLQGRSTESLLQAAMEKQSADRDLAERLAALFRRRPEAIPAAVALLRHDGPQQRIAFALATAHTQAAIDALATLAQEQATPTQVRIDALTALALVQRPSLEAMRIPTTLLDSGNARVASAARLLAGAVARAGRNEHPAEAQGIDAALIQRYRRARQVPEICKLLAALGNSVGPSALPVIEEALRDPRVPVRAEAARALRLAGAPEVDGLLSATITSDSDPQVRAAAVFAVSFRSPSGTIVDALIKAAKTDSVEYVRSDAIVQLRAHPDASPAIPATLKWISEHDPNPGVQRLAREGLASLSSQR